MIERVKDKLDVAYKTEMQGYRFYTKVSAIVDDEHGKNMFTHLAKDELDHIRVIYSIGEELKAGRHWPKYEDALKAAESFDIEGLPIFPEDEEITESIGKSSGEFDALKVAINAEGKAIEFYLDMLKEADDQNEKNLLITLVDMERNHLKLLRWQNEYLMKSGFWCDMMEFNVEKEL
jgi:rubrerythrin